MAGTDESGFHESLRRDEDVKGSSDRSFGLVFATLFALIAVSKLWHGNDAGYGWLAAAAAVLAAALTVPTALAPANRLWLKIGLLLHHVVEPLVMGVLFFLVVTPMGVALRLTGKDLLRLRRDAAATTYWIDRDPPGPTPESLRNQF
jgi:uncharacterized membrane protein